MISPEQTSKEISGNSTDIIVQPYADRILILVTQLGKVGNLLQASLPQTTPLQPAPDPDATNPNAVLLPPPPPGIQLTSLLGSAPSDHQRTLHHLYASQIATIVWVAESGGALAGPRRDVVIGLALRKAAVAEEDNTLSATERETYNAVMLSLQAMLKG
ncbi:hypothetical protein BD626DRAFT_441280 [Schizophyllum amplum]|uniref:Uncharacterized protein n=1 Tax=Schizophyllum amplum TaxID=97359 RepID=A0A550BUL5_9AGAR|nr:hypothetical protein BD626DRAFT_441280 [Auriculariopsis ampla]